MEKEDELAQAQRDVRECEQRIVDQTRLVERLEAAGQWERADNAKALLVALREGLEIAQTRVSVERAARASRQDVGARALATTPEIYVHADKVLPGAWRVEVIDADAPGAGAVTVTVFTGHQAQARALEYAGWLESRLPESGGLR